MSRLHSKFKTSLDDLGKNTAAHDCIPSMRLIVEGQPGYLERKRSGKKKTKEKKEPKTEQLIGRSKAVV